MNIPWFDPQHISIGLLILLRISALLMLLPVLGHQLVPAQIKIGLIVLLTVILYPVVQTHVPIIQLTPIAFAALAVQELLIAGAMALLAQLIFTAAQFAGQIMSFQMGMTVANVFDPATHSQQSVISQLAMTMAMLLWLATGAHHLFLRALSESFTLFPTGHAWTGAGMEVLTQAAADMFMLALKIAAPIMLLLTFVYIALGLLARAVPQIQVFFVSFPITVGLGLLTLALGMPAVIYLMNDAFATLNHSLPLLLHRMSGV
ncbi:MAG: flagellar biosynthetic protein FliR [Mariprofundaceae bacterium]